MEVEKHRVVVRTVEVCIDPPGGNGTGEARRKGNVDTGLPKGSLECGGVIGVLDP